MDQTNSWWNDISSNLNRDEKEEKKTNGSYCKILQKATQILASVLKNSASKMPNKTKWRKSRKISNKI